MPIALKIYCHHRLLSEGLGSLLEKEEDFDIVGLFSPADEFEVIAGRMADILLTETGIFLPSADEILAHEDAKVLLLWNGSQRHPEAYQLPRLVSRGISGIVPEESSTDLLKKAVRAVHAGELWLNRKLMEELISDRVDARAQLTRQERAIVSAICRGLRNKEIARQLGISEQTVKAHCNRIYKKLGVTDRLQLALYGYRTGEPLETL